MFQAFLFLLGIFFPATAFAADTEVGEVETFGEYISQIWAWATQVIFGVSVIMLIIGGIMYMAAKGDEEKVDNAKQVIWGALISTCLMLFSGVLFALLQKPTADLGEAHLADTTYVLNNIASILLGMVGGVSVIMLIYNGIQYMLSTGDLEKIEEAKSGLKYSIIGLMIAVLSYGLIRWIVSIWT